MGKSYEDMYGSERATQLRALRAKQRRDWAQATPAEQRAKPKTKRCVCKHCGVAFLAADVKASRCENCKGCLDCGVLIHHTNQRYCRKHQAKHPTAAQRAQLKRIHQNMFGEHNPSKRPEVAQAISRALKANHPARGEKRAQYVAHAHRMRQPKPSKLEDLVAPFLADFEHQYKIDFYAIDFANSQNRIAVEVQGCWHHCCQTCFPDAPTYPTQHLSLNNDKRKHSYLTKRGWRVIYLWEHEIRAHPKNTVHRYVLDS